MKPIYDHRGLRDDYGMPTDYSPAGMAEWNRGRKAWEAAWDRRYARRANRPAPHATLADRYHAAIRDAATDAATAALPPECDLTVHIGSRSLVAYLGGDRCVITIDPSTTGGPRATAAWVRRELRRSPSIDRGAAQSLGYLVGPHRPTAIA